jgi:hypothetical protein
LAYSCKCLNVHYGGSLAESFIEPKKGMRMRMAQIVFLKDVVGKDDMVRREYRIKSRQLWRERIKKREKEKKLEKLKKELVNEDSTNN